MLLALAAFLLVGPPSVETPVQGWPVAIVVPSVETEPVESLDDAADDSAIWRHPTHPARSLVLGTDKKSGLGVYSLAGKRLEFLPDGRLNNVDIRDGFPIAPGVNVSIVAASRRDDSTLVFYAIEAREEADARGMWAKVTRIGSPRPTGLGDVYGVALYRSMKTGSFSVFISEKSGRARQFELTPAENADISVNLVREFQVGSVAEGMVADDEQGCVFISEEQVAIWRYPAEAGDETPRIAIDLPRPRGHFTPDVEGLALWKTGPLSGYLVASSQGDGVFNVYGRTQPHPFIGAFRVGPSSGIDGVSETDGIEICAEPLGGEFPSGVFIAQDGDNAPSPQNFKLVRLEEIARVISPVPPGNVSR